MMIQEISINNDLLAEQRVIGLYRCILVLFVRFDSASIRKVRQRVATSRGKFVFFDEGKFLLVCDVFRLLCISLSVLFF